MLKVSSILTAAKIDRGIKRDLDRFFDTHGSVRSVPMQDIQEILLRGGYTLLQEDNTPWAGFISCPTEQNVRVVIPIGNLNGQAPDANTQYPEIGSYLVITCYKHQTGAIELGGQVT